MNLDTLSIVLVECKISAVNYVYIYIHGSCIIWDIVNFLLFGTPQEVGNKSLDDILLTVSQRWSGCGGGERGGEQWREDKKG